jgi:hypothetical protein
MVNLIGIYASKPQSGKTTVAEELVRQHGFVRVGFADTLKRMAAVMLRDLGLDEVEITQALSEGKEQPLDELHGKTPRQMLQSLGTDWGRSMIGRSIWVRCWSERTHRLLEEGGRVVVDDVRFPQEVEAIRAQGGKVIRVIRPAGASEHSLDHASEGGLDEQDFDALYINNGPLTGIPRAVSEMLSAWEVEDVE